MRAKRKVIWTSRCNSRFTEISQIEMDLYYDTAKWWFTSLHRAWIASADFRDSGHARAYVKNLARSRFPLFLYIWTINFNWRHKSMSKIFRITPKRVKRSNGQVLTPDMSITVTTRSHTTTPFYNGAVEIKEQYMRMYQFDYKKACCSVNDFEFEKLD